MTRSEQYMIEKAVLSLNVSFGLDVASVLFNYEHVEKPGLTFLLENASERNDIFHEFN